MALALYILYVAAAVVFLFGITILAHEAGHFIAARLCGMRTEVFSIGFGPAIWKRKTRNVLYRIGCLPVGGYVALPQMEPQENAPAEGEPAGEPLPPVHPLKKIVVALAGGAGNFVLAFILAWLVYLVGKPSTPAELSAVIGHVAPDSAAYASGIRPGDEIKSVNGVPVSNWMEYLQATMPHDNVALSILTPVGIRELELPTESKTFGIRVVDGISEINLCKVMMVNPGSSAEQAGIRMGDVITHFDGVKLFSFQHLVELTMNRAGDTIDVALKRGGGELTVRVTPRFDPELGRAVIGIHWDPDAVDGMSVVHVPPSVQIRRHAGAIFRVIGSLLTPKEARGASRGLGGPLIILYVFQEMVRRGVIIALSFTCFLNVNLAILNLLPLPVLDGGHVVFSLWEMAFRRPVPPAVMRHLANVFAGLLIAAVLLLTARDALRLRQIFSWAFPVEQTNSVHNAADEPAPRQ